MRLRHKYKHQFAGVMIEMVISSAILVAVFSGLVEILGDMRKQVILNQISSEIEVRLRRADSVADLNSTISMVHADIHLALENQFSFFGEDFNNYEKRISFFVYEKPEMEKPAFYAWIGLKGSNYSILAATPCVSLITPIAIEPADPYQIDLLATPTKEDVLLDKSSATKIGTGDPDEIYNFFELNNSIVETILNDFC